ncbi:GL24283 [Drosophila persimilis]|uniref:Homeobox protein EMX2 n=2 Tax=pseudoobscura subgroup TaxID=32358 RepID=A0A6I8UP19_DROPS|nr:homeobox protein EMX2 [Drosophila pseudoobscura]XP_002013705.1 homeobox protein EMX2 [Drosophila persimilis]XP_017140065.1 homeobox protein EMX2 [Drosophila miranda]EDW24691.1 GL24283 [Drosophila persimilis]
MSEFSIDYILNRAGDRYIGTNASVGVLQRIRASIPFHPYAHPGYKEQRGSPPAVVALEEGHLPMYDWLQYTRYHPPKLPRALRQNGPAKRTPGRLPRIPFTPAQLQALESAYKESNYLSAEDANKLAESLDLTNTRVKIWFQNRRARERREKRDKDESCDSTFSSNASSPEPDMLVIV